MNLAGARVLVTGATGGLGRAIARALALERADVVVSGRRVDELDSLALEIGVRAVPADLATIEGVHELARAAGPVDVLVANAALPASGRLEEFSVAEIGRAIAVNLEAPILLTRLFLDGMRERARGHLVYVGSIGGKTASPHVPLYSATKFGLRGFALSLRQDLRGGGVGVSSILPGPIRDAGMFADTGVDLPRGMGTRSPDDVAAAVVRAIHDDVAEIAVATPAVRAGAALAALSPRISAALQRSGDAQRMMSRIAAAQRDKR